MHLLNVTTASLDDLIEPVDLGQRRGRSWRRRSRTATWARWRRRGARGCRSCGWRGWRICGIRCRSTSGWRRWRRRRGWSWCGCSGGTTGGRTAATGWRRWRGSGGWRWRCCRGSAARTTRGWRRCRRRRGGRSCWGISARAGRRTWRRCWRGWRGGRRRGRRLLPRAGVWLPGRGVVAVEDVARDGRAVVPILFYRSMLLAGDAAPVAALVGRWRRRGSPGCRSSSRRCAMRSRWRWSRRWWGGCEPAALVTATAFASEGALFERLGVPVFQVIPAMTRREAWEGGPAGAGAGGSGHARGAAGAGRADPGGGGVVQGRGRARRAVGAGAAGQPAGAGPGGAGGAADRGVSQAEGAAAGGAAGGGADPGLSGGGGADRAMRWGWTCRRACWRSSPTCGRRGTGSRGCRRRRGS